MRFLTIRYFCILQNTNLNNMVGILKRNNGYGMLLRALLLAVVMSFMAVGEAEAQGVENTERHNMEYHFPSAIITSRAAAVYSWRNKFAGATAVYNYSVAGDEDHLQLKRNKWRVRMFFGFRF